MTTATAWPGALRDEKSAPFFDAAARDELAIRRCEDCATHLAPEAVACTTCAGTSLAWTTAAGYGRLISWTEVTRAPNAAFAELVPYTVAIVELDEGPWLYLRVESDRPLRSEQPVRITFVHSDEGDSYPTCRVEAA